MAIFYKRYPDSWLSGTYDLTLEQRGMYDTIIELIYARRGPLPYDEASLCRACNCDVRVLRRLIRDLVGKGKIEISESGDITNRRAMREMAASRAFDPDVRKALSDAGKAGATARWGDGAQHTLPLNSSGQVQLPERGRKRKNKDLAMAPGHSAGPSTLPAEVHDTSIEPFALSASRRRGPSGENQHFSDGIEDRRQNPSSSQIPLNPRDDEKIDKSIDPEKSDLTKPKPSPNDLHRRLLDAANHNVDPTSPSSHVVAPILDLIAQGHDLERHILPVVRDTVASLAKPLRTWNARWLRDAILAAKARDDQKNASSPPKSAGKRYPAREKAELDYGPSEGKTVTIMGEPLPRAYVTHLCVEYLRGGPWNTHYGNPPDVPKTQVPKEVFADAKDRVIVKPAKGS